MIPYIEEKGGVSSTLELSIDGKRVATSEEGVKQTDAEAVEE